MHFDFYRVIASSPSESLIADGTLDEILIAQVCAAKKVKYFYPTSLCP